MVMGIVLTVGDIPLLIFLILRFLCKFSIKKDTDEVPVSHYV